MSQEHRYLVEEDTRITITRLPSSTGGGGGGSGGEGAGVIFGAIFWLVVIALLIKGCG